MISINSFTKQPESVDVNPLLNKSQFILAIVATQLDELDLCVFYDIYDLKA